MGLIDTARAQIGKPYSGPLSDVGGGRFGDPGFDCSSFVAWDYAQNGVPGLVAFTDAMYAQTVAIDNPVAGDLVFYRYRDPAQPGVEFPHMAIWLGSDSLTIDSKYPTGVSVHPMLDLPHEFRRVDAALLAENPAVIDAGDGNSGQTLTADTGGGAGVASPPVWALVGGGLALLWALDLLP